MRNNLRGQSVTSPTTAANPFAIRSMEERKHYLDLLSNQGKLLLPQIALPASRLKELKEFQGGDGGAGRT